MKSSHKKCERIIMYLRIIGIKFYCGWHTEDLIIPLLGTQGGPSISQLLLRKPLRIIKMNYHTQFMKRPLSLNSNIINYIMTLVKTEKMLSIYIKWLEL